MEDRARLFYLVQLVKSLAREKFDSDTDGDNSAVEGCGDRYDDYGEPFEDVYADEDKKGAAMNKMDSVTFPKPSSSVRRRLDFSYQITNRQQQQQFSGPVDTVWASTGYNRIHEPLHNHKQPDSGTGNTLIYGCRRSTHRAKVHSCSSDDDHGGGISKRAITQRVSMLKSCTKPSPKCNSFQQTTAKSVTMTPRKLTSKLSGHEENVNCQRKGISDDTKLQTVMGINESPQWIPEATPDYEEMRISDYNYRSPQSSLPTPNKRLAGDQRISVCVRKRPLTHIEKRRREADVVTTAGGECVIVHESKEAVDLSRYILQHKFYFDHVFGEDNSNDEVYQGTAYPLVQHMLNGGNATCFAYGQTGAGKTHTMLGSSPGKPGLYALAARDIFSYISTTRSHSHLTVYVSFFEIYCGHLYDLLDRRKRLFAREDDQKIVHIAGLRHIRVDSIHSLLEVILQGSEGRTQGKSGVNPVSSRSHALLQIQLRDPHQQTFGRMWFVDLAGSERASDSKKPDKQSRMEGAEINQSLLALKECIRSLDQEQSHTPFRQSKLTQVLKDSFVGDSMTCMIANISPYNSATEHTLNTLRYADRVKELKGLGGRRRGKTTPCTNHNLSNSNTVFKDTRGKSPLKKLGTQRETFGPTTPTMTLPKGVAFHCSTPRNNRWEEETSTLERNGNVFDEITPIRCSLDLGDKRRRREGQQRKKDMLKWSKDNTHSFNAGLALRKSKDGQPHFWEEVQRNRRADEGNLCLSPRHSEFCNREEAKQHNISTKRGKETEMKCREQRGRVLCNKDIYGEVEKTREDLQVNESKNEREKQLRLYHQQLQQFVPSPISRSSSHQPSLTSSSSSSSNVLGCRRSVDVDTEWKVTESTSRQTEDKSRNEWEREARVRRTERVTDDDSKWAWLAAIQSEQGDRMTGAMLNDAEALMSNNYEPEEIRLGSQEEEVDASAGVETVWCIEDAEEPDELRSPHSNSVNISVSIRPSAESAKQRAAAERPLSPECEHNNTLLTLSSLNHSLGSKQSRCTSKALPVLNSLQGGLSNSCGQKELNLAVRASKMEFTSLPLTTSIKHDGCTEPLYTLPENVSYVQIHNHQDSNAKMCGLPQEESFTGFLNDTVDPLSINIHQVDLQAATNSFLGRKESIHSLDPPDTERAEGKRSGMEEEHFTCERMRGQVEDDEDIQFHMSLLEKACCSDTSGDRLGMKSSIPASCVAQSGHEPLDITASASPLKSTRHICLQTSAIQSNSPSVHNPGSQYHIMPSATQSPPQYVHNTVPNHRHSAHSGHANRSNELPQLTSLRLPNTKVEGTTNQQVTSIRNLEDMDEAQHIATSGVSGANQCPVSNQQNSRRRVVQAHWEQLQEMEALTHKEGTLLCQQPDMTFAEYINQLEVIMERKAKCVYSMLAQLQPYIKFSPSLHQQHKQEDDHNLII